MLRFGYEVVEKVCFNIIKCRHEVFWFCPIAISINPKCQGQRVPTGSRTSGPGALFIEAVRTTSHVIQLFPVEGSDNMFRFDDVRSNVNLRRRNVKLKIPNNLKESSEATWVSSGRAHGLQGNTKSNNMIDDTNYFGTEPRVDGQNMGALRGRQVLPFHWPLAHPIRANFLSYHAHPKKTCICNN